MQHVYQHVCFLVALFWNCNIQNNTLLRQRGRLSIGDFVPVFVSYNQLNLKDDQNLIVITHCYAIFERGGGWYLQTMSCNNGSVCPYIFLSLPS